MDEISLRRFSAPSGRRVTSQSHVFSKRAKPAPIHDFASFMILFNDIFMSDEFYANFGTTDDVMCSNIIGSGAQFEAKLVRLTGTMSLRTSSDPSTRLTEGQNVVLKRPVPSIDPRTQRFLESGTIQNIVNEFRVISHPALRYHPHILDVYGFAWENETHLPGISVWPIIMVEFADLGTLDRCLSNRLEPLDLDTKLRLASGIAHGVKALHACRIVHSDLKPDNIMVVQGPDGRLMAKLSDFGLSLILDERPSPSQWIEGTAGWMAPEWQNSLTNEQLYSTDIYSCGLLLWSILLDGKFPWALDVFGPEDSQIAFEEAKKADGGIADIALATALESSSVPDERADELGALLRSLLGPADERSLEPLLHYLDDEEFPDLTELSLKPPAGGAAVEDRPMFPDYQEFHALPLNAKSQMLDSISKIALNDTETPQRKAEACFTVAMLHLERVGTVRPKIPDGAIYTGFEIDGKEVLSWLCRAAKLGSPSAQAMYYPTLQALKAHMETQSKYSDVDLGEVSSQQCLDWLAQATALGSDIASKHLLELDHKAWEKAHSLLATKFCGIGKAKFEEELTRYSDVSSEFPRNLPVGNGVGPGGDSLLHLAATLGRRDVVGELCKNASYQDINKQNDQGETALLQATRSGHFDTVEYLLSIGASANLTTSEDENPLHWLSSFSLQTEEEILSLAEKMISNGAILDQVCQQNTVYNPHFLHTVGPGTPLHRAVQRNAYLAAKVLVRLGANPYQPEDNFPMALACSMHMTRFISLFLESEIPIRLPGWHGTQGLWDPSHNWEVMKAKWQGAKTYQSAAPSAWKSTEERGTEDSLLGYAISPKALHYRMALHGTQYLEQMQLAVQQISVLESQSFDRVSWDYQSALMHSIQSRDIAIVSYLVSAFPNETAQSFTNPVPTSIGARLPIQYALLLGDWPIFAFLLQHTGPSTPVSLTRIEGMTDNWLSQSALWLFTRRSTIATHKVSANFANLIHLAAAAHPDPRFIEAILSRLPADEARELVNQPGAFDELPLTMAACRHFFAVGDVLLKYGADIDAEGNKPPDGQGIARSCLGVALNFNNHGTVKAASWLLDHGAGFLVNKKHDVTALDMAIRSGGAFEVSERSPLLPVRLYRENTEVLELVLRHFKDREMVNHRWTEEKGLYGMTALHWAIIRMQPEAVRLLLEAGADPELEMRLPNGSRTVSARELAMGMDEDTIPDEVKEKGEREVKRFLRRFEEMKQLFSQDISS